MLIVELVHQARDDRYEKLGKPNNSGVGSGFSAAKVSEAYDYDCSRWICRILNSM